MQHYAYFNKHVLNPIQRAGYRGDGRRALLKLKEDVMDKYMLRRTKASKAADLRLPPRHVEIKYIDMTDVEEDFYTR